MQLRRFAFVIVLSGLVPACSALVSPDTTRLGAGPDTGGGTLDGGGIDVGIRVDTGVPGNDGGVACPASCDDMIACTTDSCDTTSGACVHAPNNAACTVGMRCSASMGCVALGCSSDGECADGNACNGTERCTAGACVDGPPLDCNDHQDCTGDSCNPASGCAHELHNALCDDSIACTVDSCTLDGCHHEANDTLCATGGCFTGASCQVGVGCQGGTPMSCPSDGDGCTSDPTMCDVASGTCLHPPRDDDGDGHATAMANGATCPDGDDCDDTDMAIHPGATELCNGVDDNCSGTIDESGCLPPGPDSCATEGPITVGSSGGSGRTGMVSGSNLTLTNDYTSMCGHAGGRDAVYYVDLPPAGGATALDVTFSTNNANTTFDTVLAATVGNTCTTNFGATRVCNDDVATGSNFRSQVTICVSGGSVATGTRVHVLVDGFDGTATGNYELDVSVASHPGGVCP